MPNVLLLCSEEDARLLKPYVAPIGMALRQATSDALNLNGPEEAAFMIFPFAAGDNAARFQILCIASHSAEREAKINNWRNLLAVAWASLAHTPETAEIAGVFSGEVETWPTMPVGKWGLFKAGVPVRG